MKTKAQWGMVAVLAAILAIGLEAAEANDLYKGKTIRLIAATTPGGVNGFFKADTSTVNRLCELLK
ncbi:MAG: hypothetical protein ACREP3_14210 [Candidatus Binatia bacterium]